MSVEASMKDGPTTRTSLVATHQPIEFTYERFMKGTISPAILTECAELFSNHYGVWSRKSEHAAHLAQFKATPGSHVKMTPTPLKRMMLFNDSCGVVVARSSDSGKKVVGHAFFTFLTVDGDKRVVWITQLVVHADYRHRGCAIGLIRSTLPSLNSIFAVGLVSSHPFAVRALEGATGVRCSKEVNKKYAEMVMKDMTVPYLKAAPLKLTSTTVDTQFFVDHETVLQLLAKEIEQGERNHERAWQLGQLDEGHEFFALSLMKSPTL